MAYLYRGQASTSINPVLDIFTHFDGTPTDVASLKFKIFDVTTDEKRAQYYSGTPDSVQVFPSVPGTYFNVDVAHLTTDSPPGHKLSTGHYFAPYGAPDDSPFGNYVIAWAYQRAAGAPEKLFQEEFVILSDQVGAPGNSLTEKLRLFMIDYFHRNELLDKIEYTPQQYDLAIELSVMRFNTIHFLTEFTLDNFPRGASYLLFMGSVGHLLVSTSIEQLRNQLTYTDGNVHVGLTDKHSLYIQAGQIRLQEFDQVARGIKNQLNNESAWGEVHSPYLPPFGGWGAFGAGWGTA